MMRHAFAVINKEWDLVAPQDLPKYVRVIVLEIADEDRGFAKASAVADEGEDLAGAAGGFGFRIAAFENAEGFAGFEDFGRGFKLRPVGFEMGENGRGRETGGGGDC